MKYEKLLCPICKQYVGKNNYKRHMKVCDGSKFKPKTKNNISTFDNLNCKYCNKLCKNLNSLSQHEIRCNQNPNRKDFNKLTNYVLDNVKGKTKENCPSIAKQCETMKIKYESGYINPNKNKKIDFQYLYSEHNNLEILKWLEYVASLNIDIPEYTIDKDSNSFGYVRICQKQPFCFEQQYIANLYLNNELNKNNTVHHIDKNRQNNDINNLMVFETSKDHKRFHNSKFAWLTYNSETHLFTCEIKKN